MMNHTKGPWRVALNNSAVVYQPEQHQIITRVEGAPVAGNAQLIAAAPELLEAAVEVAEWLDLLKQNYPDMSGLIRGCEKAKRAIAKVRGEQQRDECSHGVRRDLCPDCDTSSCDCLVEIGEDEFLRTGHVEDCKWAVPGTRIRSAACECDNTHEQNHTCCQPCWDAGFRTVNQPEPANHSHNSGCYMLGQRQVSYRTCGKLEGEPQ